MPTVDKIIEKMKQQPNGIRAVDAEKVLKAFGYEAPLKKVYVVDILKRIGE